MSVKKDVSKKLAHFCIKYIQARTATVAVLDSGDPKAEKKEIIQNVNKNF